MSTPSISDVSIPTNGSSSSTQGSVQVSTPEQIAQPVTTGGSQTWIDVALQLLKISIQAGVSIYVANQVIHALMNVKDSGINVAECKRSLAKRLRRPEIELMDLNTHEAKLSQDCIAPDDIEVSFDDIGGMEEQLEIVRDNIILPMQIARMKLSGGALPCPTGALLYGRPGTGKTMTAKALAKEANATFINVKTSTMLEKWLGESEKMATALFSLARKLAPTIIFIDEIDTVLMNREGFSNANLSTMQGTLLAEWDGLAGIEKPVIVLGATNRPHSMDKAFLRRMPVMIKVSPPSHGGRTDILRRQLRGQEVHADIDLDNISSITEGFTGSDLRELVRVASSLRAKEIVAHHKKTGGPYSSGMRPLCMSDFTYSASKFHITENVAIDYAGELGVDAFKTNSSLAAKIQKGIDQLSAKDDGAENAGDTGM